MAKSNRLSKRPLKSVLHGVQSRIKHHEDIAKAEKNKAAMGHRKGGGQPNFAHKTGSKAAAAATGSGRKRRSTIPLRSIDRILLIGEGDFSFARSLMSENAPAELKGLPAKNLTATAYDSEEECYKKYSDAKEIVVDLRAKGVEVLFNVDAEKLQKTPALKGKKWDRIVWNFPHAGKGITDQDRNILTNQLLILSFLRSTAPILSEGPLPAFALQGQPKKKKPRGKNNGKGRAPRQNHDEPDEDEIVVDEDEIFDSDGEEIIRPEDVVKTRGTVLVTLRNVVPYTLWDLPRLAKKPPPTSSIDRAPNVKYQLLRSFAFTRSDWAGYAHCMTKGDRAHGEGKTGSGGEDRMWEFALPDAVEEQDR